MGIFLEAILVVLLLIVFLQDLKFRAIHIALPLAIATVGVILFFDKGYPLVIIWHNFLFLVLTCLGLYLYLSLKALKLVNPLKSIGLGDFLFFLAVIPYFGTPNFILFFITGMLFSLISFLMIKALSKTELVPLAGLLAFYMLILKIVFYFIGLDFFETKLI